MNVAIRLKGRIPLLANVVRHCRVAVSVTGTLDACPARKVPPETTYATIGGRLVMAAGSAILMTRVHHACPSIWEGHRGESNVATSPATGSAPLSALRHHLDSGHREAEEDGEMPLQMERT